MTHNVASETLNPTRYHTLEPLPVYSEHFCSVANEQTRLQNYKQTDKYSLHTQAIRNTSRLSLGRGKYKLQYAVLS